MAPISTSASSNMNATALKASELIPLMRHNFEIFNPFALWGGPGLGKSAIVHQIAKSLGGYCIDVRLGQMSQTDIIGMPYRDTDDEGYTKMMFARMGKLPQAKDTEKYPIVILFLDEINSATQSVQGAAYQLINDRRVHDYVLPDNVAVCAAGNRDEDQGATNKFAKPLSNRFAHYTIKEDFDSWLDWAIGANQSPHIIGYLSSFKSHLNQFDPNNPDKRFATPRTWEMFNRQLTHRDAVNTMPESFVRNLATGTLGPGIASSFMQHLSVGSKLPKAADVLAGKAKKLATREVSAHYQLVTALLYELNDYVKDNSVVSDSTKTKDGRDIDVRQWKESKNYKDFGTMYTNFVNYMVDNMEKEIQIMGVKFSIKYYCFNYVTGKNPKEAMMDYPITQMLIKDFYPYVKED